MNELEDLKTAIKRLESGEPVQYIVGDVNFYGNIIEVNKNVLIPRRETEELVEKTVQILKTKFSKDISIIDIGTGSGCIPITIKKQIPSCHIDAVDISLPALETAKNNAKKNKVSINFIQSNILENVNSKYDCIISNPPYIKKDEQIMDIVKNNEPHIALYAEDEGLYFYKEILKNCSSNLKEKFLIAFEIGETQGEQVKQIAKTYFPNAIITLEQDLQHLDRFIFIYNE